jgi:hypothetical protein
MKTDNLSFFQEMLEAITGGAKFVKTIVNPITASRTSFVGYLTDIERSLLTFKTAVEQNDIHAATTAFGEYVTYVSKFNERIFQVLDNHTSNDLQGQLYKASSGDDPILMRYMLSEEVKIDDIMHKEKDDALSHISFLVGQIRAVINMIQNYTI